MALSDLSQGTGRREDALERIAVAGPVVASVAADGTCTVVVSGSDAKPGSVLKLRAAPGMKGAPLSSYLQGSHARGDERAVERTGPDDVVVFSAGFVDGDTLVVDRPATRVHDAMEGRVQVAYALACPSPTSVNKRGVLQTMSVADPASARVCGSLADLESLAADAFPRDWPGGHPGFVFRNRASGAKFVMAEEVGDGHETPSAFAARIADVNEFFAQGVRWDVIPIWRLPMGRDQSMRERLDPKVEVRQTSGAFTRTYPLQGSYRAFAPTMLVLGDEDEWAFGARTGKTRRVVLGAHPIHASVPHAASTMKTPATTAKGAPAPWGIKCLYGDERMDAMAAARSLRSPRQPKAPAPAAARAAFQGARRSDDGVRDRMEEREPESGGFLRRRPITASTGTASTVPSATSAATASAAVASPAIAPPVRVVPGRAPPPTQAATREADEASTGPSR